MKFSVKCTLETKEPTKKSSKLGTDSIMDAASNILTNLLSGGAIGNMPVAEGDVSDLFGRPLFFALYDWFMEVSADMKIHGVIPVEPNSSLR